MKKLVIFILLIYQKIVSPSTGLPYRLGFVKAPVCRFLPTCSEYMKEAVVKFGVYTGVKMGFKRLLRCRGGLPLEYDPVP
jgi:putative component of membrane protein insertase Oxa1/YidC/SpoIIIJ protein YidD